MAHQARPLAYSIQSVTTDSPCFGASFDVRSSQRIEICGWRAGTSHRRIARIV